MTSTAASLLALGDPNRLLLLRVLLEGPRSVGELMVVSGLGQSLVSHHLAVLVRAGWVAARRQGRRRVYTTAASGTPLAPLAAWIRREIPPPATLPGRPSPLVEAPVPARPAGGLEDWLL